MKRLDVFDVRAFPCPSLFHMDRLASRKSKQMIDRVSRNVNITMADGAVTGDEANVKYLRGLYLFILGCMAPIQLEGIPK